MCRQVMLAVAIAGQHFGEGAESCDGSAHPARKGNVVRLVEDRAIREVFAARSGLWRSTDHVTATRNDVVASEISQY